MGEAIVSRGWGVGWCLGGGVGNDQNRLGFFSTAYFHPKNIEGLLQTFPFARTARGHSGFFGSKRGIAVSEGFSIWPFQGLFMRCGETRIHSPRRGLYLVCWYSVGSKIPGFIWSQKSTIIAFLMAEPRTVLYTGQWFLVFAHAVLSVRSPPLLAKMALLNQKAFERKLQNMSSTQDSVQTVSLWMIHHKKHAMDMGKIWLDQLKKGKVRPPSGASPGLFTICVYWQIRRMTRFSFLLELHSCTFRLQLR